MKRSDKRRIARGLIICDNGHWYKLIHHGKLRDCPHCIQTESPKQSAMLMENTNK